MYIFGEWCESAMDGDSYYNVFRALQYGTEADMADALLLWKRARDIVEVDPNTDTRFFGHNSLSRMAENVDEWVLFMHYDTDYFFYKEVEA